MGEGAGRGRCLSTQRYRSHSRSCPTALPVTHFHDVSPRLEAEMLWRKRERRRGKPGRQPRGTPARGLSPAPSKVSVPAGRLSLQDTELCWAPTARSLRAAGTEGVAPAALVLVVLPRTVHLLCKPSLRAPRLTALRPAGWPCILSAPYRGQLCVAGVLGFSDAHGSHCRTQQQDLTRPKCLTSMESKSGFSAACGAAQVWTRPLGTCLGARCHASGMCLALGWVTPRGDGLATLADTGCHFRVIPKPLVLHGLVLQLFSCFCSTVPRGGGPEGLAFCARLCHEFISFTGKCPHLCGSTH